MAYVQRAQATSTKKQTKTFYFGDVRGVDFRSDEPQYFRTPDSVNMYRPRQAWETHPGFRSMGQLDDAIYDIYHFKYIDDYSDIIEKVLIHSGSKVYVWNNYPTAFTSSTVTEIYNGIMACKTRTAMFKDVMLIADGENLYFFDGEIFDLAENRAFIPQTHQLLDYQAHYTATSGTSEYQQRNRLTPMVKAGYVGDGTNKTYQLPYKEITNDSVTAWYINSSGSEVALTISSVDRTNGTVTFSSAPPSPSTAGTENVYIQFGKRDEAYNRTINQCTEILIYDNRVFLTGNSEFPNYVFWSENGDYSYFGELDYSEQAGQGSEPIIALQRLSDNRFVSIKQDTNTESAYAVWTTSELDSETISETYIPSLGNANIGCVSTFAHRVFMDDNVYLSSRGLSAISRSLSLSNERNIEHRSTLVDNKLNKETLEDAMMEQHRGMLYILFPNGHCYIANSALKASYSSSTYSVSNYTEYEWAYLKNVKCSGTNNTPSCIKSFNDDEMYIGFENGKVCKFYFDQESSEGKYAQNCYLFDGQSMNEYVDSPFSWFSAQNRYKKLIRKYNDLYCDTSSHSEIKVQYRTEKSHIADSRVLEFETGEFDFGTLDFANITFDTLPALSFVLRKIKGKRFRRMQIRISSNPYYIGETLRIGSPVIFKSLVMDAYILTRRLK